ncbi:MAG: AraC family transcriptional regulator [Bacteroidota bacterium]
MAQNRITALQQDAYPITPAMMRLIKEIMHSQKPSYSQKLFLQARVMELLMLQVEQLQAVQLPTGKQIDKAFQEKMYALKAFLDQQIRANFSIKSLAKQYETNECSLKKGFKATFGYTIFDYWNTQRFDYASNLLKSGKSVQEVAYEMGYNSPQNFSTAFKKRMGYSPKQALQ